MPKGVKPPITFQGKKGRSGRKSAPVEFARNNVIKKSWNILDTHLKSIDNVNVALPIALRDMTSKSAVDVSVNISLGKLFEDAKPK
jgi:hypothetical protein